jgi:hypothetical protein
MEAPGVIAPGTQAFGFELAAYGTGHDGRHTRAMDHVEFIRRHCMRGHQCHRVVTRLCVTTYGQKAPALKQEMNGSRA